MQYSHAFNDKRKVEFERDRDMEVCDFIGENVEALGKIYEKSFLGKVKEDFYDWAKKISQIIMTHAYAEDLYMNA